MKISPNFEIQEFVPKAIWDKYGISSTFFISPKIVEIAEFYKAFFTVYFKNKYRNNTVKVISVLIVINDWHRGGKKQFSGFRPPDYKEGGVLSQHRFKDGFDCEIIIVFSDGTKLEADYKEIHQIIKDREYEFFSKGITAIEDVAFATGWLHTDTRWILNQKKILIVKPIK